MAKRNNVSKFVNKYIDDFDNKDGRGFCIHHVVAYVRGNLPGQDVSENSVYVALGKAMGRGDIDKMSLSYKCESLDRNHTFYFPNAKKVQEIKGVMVLSQNTNIAGVCIDALEAKRTEIRKQLIEIEDALRVLKGVSK